MLTNHLFFTTALLLLLLLGLKQLKWINQHSALSVENILNKISQLRAVAAILSSGERGGRGYPTTGMVIDWQNHTMASRRPRAMTERKQADKNVKITKTKGEGLKCHSKGHGCGVCGVWSWVNIHDNIQYNNNCRQDVHLCLRRAPRIKPNIFLFT